MDIVTEFQCTKSNIKTHDINSFFLFYFQIPLTEKILINHSLEVFLISTE